MTRRERIGASTRPMKDPEDFKRLFSFLERSHGLRLRNFSHDPEFFGNIVAEYGTGIIGAPFFGESRPSIRRRGAAAVPYSSDPASRSAASASCRYWSGVQPRR